MIGRLRPYTAWISLSGALLIIAVLQGATANGSPPQPALSVDSAAPNGGLAAYRWLQEIGYHVRTGALPVTDAARDRARTETVVIMRDGTPVDAAAAAHLLSWVEAGGRLVLAANGSTAASVINLLHASLTPLARADVMVTQPILQAPPVATLFGVGTEGISVPGGAPAAKADDVPVVDLLRRGRGQIWLISAPDMLSNRLIARADDRSLLLNLVGSPGRTITFDESGVHSTPPVTASNWFTETQWGAAVLFLAGLIVLYRWLSGWRLGPAIVPLADAHRPLTEYVISLGSLLRRAHRREDTLRTYQQNLERELRARWDTSEWADIEPKQREQIQRLLAPTPRLSEAELVMRASEIARFERDLREPGV